MGIFSRFFNKKVKKENKITYGERDKTNGHVSVYCNGDKTSVVLVTFTPEESKKLSNIVDKIYKNYKN